MDKNQDPGWITIRIQDIHHEFAKLPLINIIKKGVLLASMTFAEESYPLKKVYPQNLAMPFLGSLKGRW